MKKLFLLFVLLMTSFALAADDSQRQPRYTYVEMITNQGRILIELDRTAAPLTIDHFLSLVDAEFYNGLVFHRVIADFMIQGGGFDLSLTLKEDDATIPNESGNGRSNVRGTIAMARTSDPHSANSQFYINVADNSRLDPRNDRWGYTVFGKVIEGMEVVDEIANTRTGPQGQFDADVPQVPIVIEKAARYTFETS